MTIPTRQTNGAAARSGATAGGGKTGRRGQPRTPGRWWTRRRPGAGNTPSCTTGRVRIFTRDGEIRRDGGPVCTRRNLHRQPGSGEAHGHHPQVMDVGRDVAAGPDADRLGDASVELTG